MRNHIVLSASLPDNLTSEKKETCLDSIQSLVEDLLLAGESVSFVGHLSVLPAIITAAKETMGMAGRGTIGLFKLGRFTTEEPTMNEFSMDVFDQVHIYGTPTSDIVTDLSTMREDMCMNAVAAIFIGGKIENSLTITPGLIVEATTFWNLGKKSNMLFFSFADGAAKEAVKYINNSYKDDTNIWANYKHIFSVKSKLYTFNGDYNPKMIESAKELLE